MVFPFGLYSARTETFVLCYPKEYKKVKSLPAANMTFDVRECISFKRKDRPLHMAVFVVICGRLIWLGR
jgi:hypothetical protein